MTTASAIAKTVQEIIKKLKTVTDVTKFVGSGNSARIYGAHISTIQDRILPAISITTFPSEGKAIDDAEIETLDFQLDFWFSQIGKNHHTWDDVMECHQAALNELHNNGGWDDVVGVKIYMVENISQGPVMFEQDEKIMHFVSRYRVKVTL